MFIPAVGSRLPVTVPGEIALSTVKRVVDANTVVVELPQLFGKANSYKKGDLVAARRRRDALFGEQWKSVEQIRMPTPAELAPPKPEPTPAKPKSKRPTKRTKKLTPAPKAKKNARIKRR